MHINDTLKSEEGFMVDLSRCQEFKALGNAAFEQRDYRASVDEYGRALSILQDPSALSIVHHVASRSTGIPTSSYSSDHPSAMETMGALKSQLQANRSLALIRLGRWSAAAEDGLDVINSEPEDARLRCKGLYRRGLALLMGVQECVSTGNSRVCCDSLLHDVEEGMRCFEDVESLGSCGVPQDTGLMVEQLGYLRDWVRWSAKGADSTRGFLGVDEWVLDDEENGVLDDEKNGVREEEKNGVREEEKNGVRQIVGLLWRDVLGVEEEQSGSPTDVGVDVEHSTVDLLSRLVTLIENQDARAQNVSMFWVLSTKNIRLLFYLMNESDARSWVCRVLSSTCRTCVVWPVDLWVFLLERACGKKWASEAAGECRLAEDCMGVLLEISRGNAWARNYLLTKSWEGGDFFECSMVEMIATAVGTCHLSARSIGKEAVALGCRVMTSYASDDTGVGQLKSLRFQKGSVLMHMLSAFENAREIIWGSKDEETNNEMVSSIQSDTSRVDTSGTEAKAKQELIRKQRDVYDPLRVGLQKDILRSMKGLCCSLPFVISELIEWEGGRKCASQLHHRLIALGRMLISKCPKRSTKVCDMHMNVVSYEKKPFAADFDDNPAGDFLAHVDLEKGVKGLLKKSEKLSSHGHGAAGPLLHEYLELLVNLLDLQSSFVTKLLFKAGILSLCEILTEFVTSITVELAQRICAKIVSAVKEARLQLLESSNVVLLSGILTQGDPSIQEFALGELVCATPSCTGDDLKFMIDSSSQVLEFVKGCILATDPTVKQLAVRLTAELAKRTIESGSFRVLRDGNKIPKGYAWGCMDEELIGNILYRVGSMLSSDAGSSIDVDHLEGLGAGLARGFQANRERRIKSINPPLRKEMPQPPAAEGSVDKELTAKQAVAGVKQERCEVTEIFEDNVKSDVEIQGDEEEEESEDDGVHEVYDSTPAEHIREARAQWLALDQKEKLSWEQTSSDIIVRIKVPKETPASDIDVSVFTNSMKVTLRWYGKILHGDLFGGVKAHEFTWCLNDDSEIYIVLPKDSKEHWWKTLIQGWEEKGYYELLKEAVDADEPHVPYDDMDESAKDLLDSMLERQAYINSGLLDLENGFDDFRIVLSDSSLKASNN
jgi:hypothetical protein